MPGQAVRVARLKAFKVVRAEKALGAGTLPRNRQSYLNDRWPSSRAGLALCHKSRHASRPPGVRLIVHVARQSSQTAGSQLVQSHAANSPARCSYSAGSAPARHPQRRIGDACPAAARVIVLAVAGPVAADPEKPAAIHHRLQRRPRCCSQKHRRRPRTGADLEKSKDPLGQIAAPTAQSLAAKQPPNGSRRAVWLRRRSACR